MNFHHFYTLLAVVLLLAPHESRQTESFQPICNLPARKLQGVTALGEKVLLAVDDHLYHFPFTGDYVHTERAMMALFSQPLPRDLPSAPVHWTSLKYLEPVVSHLGGQENARKVNLEALTYCQTASGDVKFAQVSLQVLRQSRQYVVNLTSGQIIAMAPQGKPPVVHLSSGNDTKLGLTVFRNLAGQVFFTSGPVVVNGRPQIQTVKSISSFSNSAFAAIAKGSHVIFRPQYNGGDRPLIVDPDAVFGFIFKEVVHLWDFKKKTVYLFKVPSTGDLSLLSLGTEVRREPMSSYFICSSEAWRQKLNAIPPVEDSSDKEVIVIITTDDDGDDTDDKSVDLSWITIVVLSAILILLIIILVVVGLFHHYSDKNQLQNAYNPRKLGHRRKRPKESPKRSPRKSPHQMRRGGHQKKASFSSQTSSVTSSQAESSVLVRRMLADREPSSLSSMRTSPFDQDASPGGPQKILFKAKLLSKTTMVNKTMPNSTDKVVGLGKIIVVNVPSEVEEKTTSEDHHHHLSSNVEAQPKKAA